MTVSAPRRARFLLLLLVLLLKAAYLLVTAWADTALQPLPFDRTDWNPRADSGAYFLFNHGDTDFYEEIARTGYPPTTRAALVGAHSVHAFWPTYPLLVAAGMRLTGRSFNEVALVLSVLFSLAAFALAYDWFRRFAGEPTAFWATLLLLIFPFHVYYSVFYTEALFVLLMLAGFWCVEQRRWAGLLLIGPALVLTRANGALVCAALAVRLIEVVGWPRTRREVGQVLIRLLYFVPAALALVGYLFFQHDRTGDYLAFSTAQAAWGRYSAWPWETLAEGFRSLTGSLQATYGLAAMVLAAVGLRRYPLSLNVLVWSSLLLPLFSGLTQSLPRYVSTLFPLFLILGAWLAGQRPAVRRVLVLSLLLLHFATLLPWLYNHHSGF